MPLTEGPTLCAFGGYRVDPAQRVLLCGSQIVPLPPKTFDLLLALVEARGQVISKEHLLNSIWPDAFVEEGNLAKGVHLLRKQLVSCPRNT